MKGKLAGAFTLTMLIGASAVADSGGPSSDASSCDNLLTKCLADRAELQNTANRSDKAEDQLSQANRKIADLERVIRRGTVDGSKNNREIGSRLQPSTGFPAGNPGKVANNEPGFRASNDEACREQLAQCRMDRWSLQERVIGIAPVDTEAQLRKANRTIGVLEALLRTMGKTPGDGDSEGAIRFPFGWTPETTKAEIERAHRLLCGEPKDNGVVRCWVDASGDLSFSVADFTAREIGLDFLSTQDGLFLLGVTLTQNAIRGCNAMADAHMSAAALIKARYKGPRIKASQGKAHGKRQCKFYMDEGNVFVDRSSKDWSVRTDTYWLDGSYSVYISFTYRRMNSLRAARDVIESRSKMGDSLRKL